MPLDRLIDLLAEAAVRKLSQEREQQEATPDAIGAVWRQWMNKSRRVAWRLNDSLTRSDYPSPNPGRNYDDCCPLSPIGCQ
ncbi:hypothetical protein SAMN04488020_11716 [Palleronia marisminoris]|uniref:Uncharacterized protein n=1 Tax=Palleronia marisminoris TaxID=315423 RepID=A0A1Y5TVQ0_9RHOB|nr:hypothetical protein SAMN04488020_11716 [Palleronia marisminoris]SLN69520.1 hypothetical protein PAM7066_03517 [Palleronia marisminoris]